MSEVGYLFEQQLVNQFNLLLTQRLTELNHAVVQSQKKIDGIKAAYSRENNAQIALLKEQESIASTLDVAENQLLKVLETYNSNPGVVSLTGAQPNYMQGYLELRQRIKLLQQRSENAYYGEDLAQAEKEHYMLLNDVSVDNARRAYGQTDLAKGKFSAVRYNANAVQIQPKINSSLILQYKLT